MAANFDRDFARIPCCPRISSRLGVRSTWRWGDSKALIYQHKDHSRWCSGTRMDELQACKMSKAGSSGMWIIRWLHNISIPGGVEVSRTTLRREGVGVSTEAMKNFDLLCVFLSSVCCWICTFSAVVFSNLDFQVIDRWSRIFFQVTGLWCVVSHMLFLSFFHIHARHSGNCASQYLYIIHDNQTSMIFRLVSQEFFTFISEPQFVSWPHHTICSLFHIQSVTHTSRHMHTHTYIVTYSLTCRVIWMWCRL